ncbi:MAG TPA: hypothetical protein PKG93_04655 [Bacilli bacterium]|nr:hypothetical protein [Bacilli bacterium]
MKYFLEITKDLNEHYYLTHKNWYDWNKPGNWSDVGIKFGTRDLIWEELKLEIEKRKIDHIFGLEYVIDFYNQWNREKILNKLGI